MKLNKVGSFSMQNLGQSKSVIGEFMKKKKKVYTFHCFLDHFFKKKILCVNSIHLSINFHPCILFTFSFFSVLFDFPFIFLLSSSLDSSKQSMPTLICPVSGKWFFLRGRHAQVAAHPSQGPQVFTFRQSEGCQIFYDVFPILVRRISREYSKHASDARQGLRRRC